MAEPKDTLLIQGDSLPFPRPSTPYEETWPGLLRAGLTRYEVVNRAQSEKTSADLASGNEVHHGRELEFYDPAVVVLQIGVVDCAPRYLSRTSKTMIRALPSDLLTTGCIYAARGLRRRSRRRAYVSEAAFRDNIREYFQRAMSIDVQKVVAVKILPPGEKFLDRNPTVADPIHEYNAAIETVAEEFDHVTAIRPLADEGDGDADLVEELTASDGYHLNTAGHERLYRRIRSEIGDLA